MSEITQLKLENTELKLTILDLRNEVGQLQSMLSNNLRPELMADRETLQKQLKELEGNKNDEADA